MKIEHFAIIVSEPGKVAEWYCENLGFSINRTKPKPDPSETYFLSDSSGNGVLEIYRNQELGCPNYREMHPLTLHLAMQSDNPKELRDKLLGAGASIAEDYVKLANGDELVMMRDPWGFALQLCKRSKAMN